LDPDLVSFPRGGDQDRADRGTSRCLVASIPRPHDGPRARSAIMATVPRQRRPRELVYPTQDGKPMAETDLHRDDMTDLIQTVKDFFARARRVYVSGNLLVFYEEGNRRKHVAPDVFVVRGVKKHDRENYLVWAEGRAPHLVMEITSKSTRREDQKKK